MKRAILLMTLLATAGCGSANSTGPSPTSVGVFTTTDLVMGTGPTAVVGSSVTVTYAGWLYDTSKPDGKGTQFDSGSVPLGAFVIGAGTKVKGFEQGIVGMKVGGQRRVIIPPELAYGNQSPAASIPPNATLVFDITLTAVQ
jgi:FKBP-type peptidyl-prolyl cis-trans isomerase FkpA